MIGQIRLTTPLRFGAALLLCCGAFIAALPIAAADDGTPVIAARAEERRWVDTLQALGTLRAAESVTLSSTITEVVEEISFNSGDKVEAGELLIRLNDNEEQAQLRATEALRDERRNIVQRSTQLLSRNLAARADVEDSQARLRQSEAEVEAIEARLADHRLRAPFDGVIGFRNISRGSLVTPGTELVTLDMLETLKLDFTLPAVHLASLQPGQQLTATTGAYPEMRFEGEIADLATRVDPATRSIAIRAELPNPALLLRPGMLMQVVLERSPRQALTIPEEALTPSGNKQFVLVIDETDKNRITRRQVEIGERRFGQVEILSGLQPGDLVVSHGVQLVREGDRVALLGIDDEDTDIPELLERSRVDVRQEDS
ncbi:MAG TPA: efflux RND transporter periplasmic adaptor subunit [Modicisalibacter sp.]|nr:efflux RND transporter periplasmic adaptor subunit [Modicisalibacter sp.]